MGYEGRNLGPVQMTTDTAVRVTRMVVQDRGRLLLPPIFFFLSMSWRCPTSFTLYGLADAMTFLTEMPHLVPLSEIPYIDYPEIQLDEHESVEMPFRYVKGPDGKPVMPEVCHPSAQRDSQS